jgi:hypothetical protein
LALCGSSDASPTARRPPTCSNQARKEMGVGPPAAFSSFFSHFVMSFPGGSNTSGFWSGGLLWYISSSASGLILLADCQPFRTNLSRFLRAAAGISGSEGFACFLSVSSDRWDETVAGFFKSLNQQLYIVPRAAHGFRQHTRLSDSALSKSA